MSFDPKTLIALSKDVILTPAEAGAKHAAAPADAAQLYKGIVIPFVVLGTIAQLIGQMLGGGFSVTLLMMTVVWGLIVPFALSFVLAFISGFFGGAKDQPKALHAIVLAAIPGYVAGLLSFLPIVGAILPLIGSLYGLYVLYLIIPAFLHVTEEKRLAHFGTYFLAAVVLFLLLSMLFAPGVPVEPAV